MPAARPLPTKSFSFSFSFSFSDWIPNQAVTRVARFRRLLPAITLAALVLGTGCTSAKMRHLADEANREAAAGSSPFRWEVYRGPDGEALRRIMLELPSGETRADPELKADVLGLIGKAEARANRRPPVLSAIKPLPNNREVWVLESTTPGEGIAYIVTLRPATQGGTDILLTGPTTFALRGSR